MLYNHGAYLGTLCIIISGSGLMFKINRKLNDPCQEKNFLYGFLPGKRQVN